MIVLITAVAILLLGIAWAIRKHNQVAEDHRLTALLQEVPTPAGYHRVSAGLHGRGGCDLNFTCEVRLAGADFERDSPVGPSVCDDLRSYVAEWERQGFRSTYDTTSCQVDGTFHGRSAGASARYPARAEISVSIQAHRGR